MSGEYLLAGGCRPRASAIVRVKQGILPQHRPTTSTPRDTHCLVNSAIWFLLQSQASRLSGNAQRPVNIRNDSSSHFSGQKVIFLEYHIFFTYGQQLGLHVHRPRIWNPFGSRPEKLSHTNIDRTTIIEFKSWLDCETYFARLGFVLLSPVT